jgi:hypothetical protein
VFEGGPAPRSLTEYSETLHRSARFTDALHIQATADVLARPLVFQVPASPDAVLQNQPGTQASEWRHLVTVHPHDQFLAPLRLNPSSAINLGIQNGRVWALEPPWSDAGCGVVSFDDADLAFQICPLSVSSPSPSALSMQVDCLAREGSSSSSPVPCRRTGADPLDEPPEEPSLDSAHLLNEPSDSDAKHYEQEEAWSCNETRVAAQRCALVYNCNLYCLSVQACFCLGRLA